jgi:nitrous oxidase accessory protein NosD
MADMWTANTAADGVPAIPLSLADVDSLTEEWRIAQPLKMNRSNHADVTLLIHRGPHTTADERTSLSNGREKFMRIVYKLAIVVAVVTAGVLSPSTRALAAQTLVVHPGQSIQAAVDKAKPGDTVRVRPGTYREMVVIQKSNMTLAGDSRSKIRPPSHLEGLCSSGGDAYGICVIPPDLDPATFTYHHRARNVTITGFDVSGFASDGLFAFGTDNLRVSNMTAKDNDEYGITRFDSINGYFRNNTISGGDEAGIYIGDSQKSNMVASGNRVTGALFGVLIRHSRAATIENNVFTRNCVGVVVLNDGEPGGAGSNHIAWNTIRNNNQFCPPLPDEGTPALQGSGIWLAGADKNLVEHNTVIGNRGDTVASGGIALTGAGPGGPGSTGNNIRHNKLSRNKPGDIVWDSVSTPNHFNDNRCAVSIPSGAC